MKKIVLLLLLGALLVLGLVSCVAGAFKDSPAPASDQPEVTVSQGNRIDGLIECKSAKPDSVSTLHTLHRQDTGWTFGSMCVSNDRTMVQQAVKSALPESMRPSDGSWQRVFVFSPNSTSSALMAWARSDLIAKGEVGFDALPANAYPVG